MLLRRTLLTLRKPLLLLFVFAFLVFAYMVLHEAGHAIAGLLAGGSLQEFDVNLLRLSAHAEVAGPFSPAGLSFVSAAGVGLPMLVWVGFMLATPKRANPVLELVKMIGTTGVLSSLWPWLVVPLLYRAGLAPAGDDTARLLAASGLDPRLVTGGSAVAFGVVCGLFLARIGGLAEELAVLMAPGEVLLEGKARRSLLVMAGLWLLAGLALLA